MAAETRRSYTILDVFTEVPLEGNALAVFDDGSGLDEGLMQRVARELNLSETVFVLPPSGGTREGASGGSHGEGGSGGSRGEGGSGADARVRIFTPSVELPFAGHPVLGTAFVLAERSGADSVTLETGAGLVPVALRRSDGMLSYGEMDQPIPEDEPFECRDAVLAALGVTRSELPVEAYRNGPVFVYVGLPSEPAVEALRPDLNALARLEGAVGVSCFALASDGHGVKTRMFAPAAGVPEDPATGSAAGPLAVHLARHGWISYGDEIEIRQGAEIGRPSLLRARVEGSGGQVESVVVGGAAVAVARGEYRIR